MNMSVSQIIKEKDQKKIYILFSEEDKSAEILYPECRIIKNSGFTPEETEALCLYMKTNKDQIEQLAKSVSLWKAFAGSGDKK